MGLGKHDEIIALAKTLDPDGNGYIEYKDFAKKFLSNLAEAIENKSPNNMTVLPNRSLTLMSNKPFR